MPGFDQSGPMGAGPMTGGARGRCGNLATGYGRELPPPASFGRGLAYGRGFRGGRGPGRRMQRTYGNGVAVQPSETAGSATDELNRLKTEADFLNNSLQTIHNRIIELEKIL